MGEGQSEAGATKKAPTPPNLSAEEQKKRGQRNLAIALSLVAFIVIVFFVTILKIGASIPAS